MYKSSQNDQKMYEEVYHVLRNMKIGHSAKWRGTTIERIEPGGNFKMNDGLNEYYHWHPHMAAIIVISLCEKLPLGQVQEVNS
ncbi:hypothetical protein [Neobacillus cucumis]|uniref:Uncharacterized protein n=1 Tax=Neobacillus cucumis TaxID=1740721 RepID=A0A2N5H8V8_9BACI|nr:hypothetical protein [Neobacillus cucumis]PLS01944.1 hypothetical protein CVD27_22785 [Neobacillus cucumis]